MDQAPGRWASEQILPYSHPTPPHPTGSGDFAALAVEGCCAQHMPGAQRGHARLPGLMSGGPQRPQKLSTSSESLLPSGVEGVRAGVWTGGGGSKRGVISRGLTMRTCWPQTPSLSPGVRFPLRPSENPRLNAPDSTEKDTDWATAYAVPCKPRQGREGGGSPEHLSCRGAGW